MRLAIIDALDYFTAFHIVNGIQLPGVFDIVVSDHSKFLDTTELQDYLNVLCYFSLML